ncbi:alpha-amylase family glycosyl hydrolase [Glaciecola sp. KUL10]|uniref:alpha-amylase family glycosyl hydrolase n=1 Tax=Glaciecola sp. (strain KUL10) TaxID=2161813 RepID=UPI000D786A62|nr:alpha-amylase family glycosyl hydrolase [Glaciecola sp. KUL10]GBL05880.1 alpha-amylase [Glaciecola sp. KUL10]
MSVKYPVEEMVKFKSPDWTKNASIYQVNTRQYSAKGDFASVTLDLARIKRLGCDIVWIMPIHEIGLKNRKGKLGSPYAVKDYYSINPEFGTESDLKALVATAHSLDLKVILDWVPNHSAWDNPIVESHPDWYAKDHKGDFRPSPWWDWDDIIEFDYDQVDLREYMINALCYWVREFDIDGYRCDVAGYVPNDFWKQARQALDRIKPVFMLAEWENRDLHMYAFDMSYAWSWNETLFAIVKGDACLDKLRKYYSWNERAWPKKAFRMTFISNHDENAWEGTPNEKFGNAQKVCIVLSCLGEGMPLIHNGQEAGESKRLAFFERDPIEWQPHEIGDFYQRLLTIKKAHSALWNGEYGATMIQVPNSNQSNIFSFIRQDTHSKWFIVLNFNAQEQAVDFGESLFLGEYEDALTNESIHLESSTILNLASWGYKVFKAKR